MGFAVILGEAVGSQIIPAKAAFCGFLTGFLLLGACMVLDFDRGIHMSNTPNEILPADAVSPNEALSFAIVLTSFGLLSAAYLGTLALLTAVLCVVVIIAYHAWAKRLDLVGEVFVGGFMALIFIFAGVAVGRLTWPLAIFAMMAFLGSTGRAIMRNLAQVKESSSSGAKSEPANAGYGQAGKRSAASFLATVAVSVLPPLRGLVSIYFIPLAVICDIGFLLTAYSLLISPTPHTAKRNSKYVLLWMSFGLLAFVIGTI
jgi:4-hydroxybenzoate polyprenyltransferase